MNVRRAASEGGFISANANVSEANVKRKRRSLRDKVIEPRSQFCGRFYPLLRRPAASPLIVRWIARCVRTSVAPPR